MPLLAILYVEPQPIKWPTDLASRENADIWKPARVACGFEKRLQERNRVRGGFDLHLAQLVEAFG